MEELAGRVCCVLRLYFAPWAEHHRKRGFAEELKLFVERYGLEWRKDKE